MLKGSLKTILACSPVAFGLVTPSHGIDVVTGIGLPNAGFPGLSRSTPRVVQQFFDESFFSSVSAPTQIAAMSFRLPPSAGTDYPALGDLNFGRYEITLAVPSADAASANGLPSMTFASNMAEPVLVRSGPLTIPRFSFESNALGVPGEFSFSIPFDTPYTYIPGQALVMLVRHDGHGVNDETVWQFDAYQWPNGTIEALSNPDATSAPLRFQSVNRVKFTFVPAPGGLAALVIVYVCGMRRQDRGTVATRSL